MPSPPRKPPPPDRGPQLQTLVDVLIRLVLFAAGLVVAASLAVAFVILLLVGSLRLAWARLTGRPIGPLAFRVDPRGGFDRVYRARPRDKADVTDVEPK